MLPSCHGVTEATVAFPIPAKSGDHEKQSFDEFWWLVISKFTPSGKFLRLETQSHGGGWFRMVSGRLVVFGEHFGCRDGLVTCFYFYNKSP